MDYLPWAVLGLLAYGLVAPLVSAAGKEIPSAVVLLIATVEFLAVTIGVIAVTGEFDLSYFVHPTTAYLYAAGVLLAVGILAYYHALSAGPVSVVVPIYGMFIVGSSLIGIAVLGDAFSARKGLGIGCAVAAVYLVSREGG